MNTRLLFNISAAVEVLTGIAMLLAPMLVVELLLGEGLGAVGVAVTRVLGVGLLSLGISTWETASLPAHNFGRAGLCSYNIGVTVLLLFVGVTGETGGPLLWPVVGLHGLIGAAMIFAFSG